MNPFIPYSSMFCRSKQGTRKNDKEENTLYYEVLCEIGYWKFSQTFN